MSNDIKKYISILRENANLNQEYYDKNDKPDLDAFPDIAGQTKNDNGDYGPFQQWLIDNQDPHQKHFRAWKAQSPTPNAFTDTGMIQQYFDQHMDQYTEFVNWYEQNKDRFSNNYQAKMTAKQWMEQFNKWLDANPDIKAKYKRYKSNQKPQSMNEVRLGPIEVPNRLAGTIAVDFLKSAPGLARSFGNFLIPNASAAAQDQEEPEQEPELRPSTSGSGEIVSPAGGTTDDGKPNDFGAEPQRNQPPADQSGPDPEDDIYSGDDGDFAPGASQPADDFDDEREGNDLKNPYSDITVGPDGSLNKPKPGKREFDQEGNVVAKPKVPNQAPTGGSGNISSRPGPTGEYGDEFGTGFAQGSTTRRVQQSPGQQTAPTASAADAGKGPGIPQQTAPTASAADAGKGPGKPQQQQPPVPKPRPTSQPKYYPGVTEPDYNKSLRIAQNTLKQAQQKLSQGNLSNLDKMQAQTDVQRQNQLINMYQNDLLANPRTERGKLIHHRNMLNRSAVASGQAGDQKTRASYKKQAAQVSQQIKTVKESKLIDLQSYINKL